MRLHIEKQLPCDPLRAWSLVTDPVKMNLWSTFPIRSLAAGDGEHPAAVGALRRFELPLHGRPVFDETVVRSIPGRLLESRVVRGGSVRSQVATIELRPSGAGALISWDIDAKFAHPLIESRAKRRLVPQFERGLERLMRAALDAHESSVPPERDLEDPASVREWIRQSRQLRHAQLQLAESMSQVDDPKGWFARYSAEVTTQYLKAVDAGVFTHPDWALRILSAVDAYFLRAAEAYLKGVRSQVESHWVDAFERMAFARGQVRSGAAALGPAIAYAFEAQLEEDMPRALSKVFVETYLGRCDYARFRADFIVMAELYWRAARSLVECIGTKRLPASVRLRAQLGEEALVRKVMGWKDREFMRAWLGAFQRGDRLVGLIQSPLENRSNSTLAS